MKPRQPARERKVPIPVRCVAASPSPHQEQAKEFHHGRHASCVPRVRHEVRPHCAVRLHPVLRTPRGEVRLQPARRRRRLAAPAHPVGPAERLALRRLPAAQRRPAGPERPHAVARRPAGRLHAARARRSPRRAPRPPRGLGQERRAQPDALLQGPRRRRRRPARPRARLRHAGVRLDRQPRQRRGRRGRRAGDAVLRLHPVGPRGAEDPRDRRLRDEPREGPRDVRRRQPPLHRDLRRAGVVGVRERQHAALLRRGLQDDRLRDRRAARLRDPGADRRPDRLRLAVHEDRQGVRGVARARPRRG